MSSERKSRLQGVSHSLTRILLAIFFTKFNLKRTRGCFIDCISVWMTMWNADVFSLSSQTLWFNLEDIIIYRFAIEIYLAQAIIISATDRCFRGCKFAAQWFSGLQDHVLCSAKLSLRGWVNPASCFTQPLREKHALPVQSRCFVLTGIPSERNGGDCPVLVWPRIRPYLALHVAGDLSLFLNL